MRRLALPLLSVLLLAACAGTPQRTSRGPGNSIVVANGAYHAPPPGFPNFVDHSIGREEISIQAMSLVGVPYRWGGNTPDSGFDCSGLVRYVVLRAASVNLPRTTADMSGRGESIEPDQIAPGDLIFFNTTGRAHSHVGIYVGKLRFVNAPSTGGTVRLDYLTNSYWAKRFDGIRRVAAPATPAPFDTPSYQATAPQPERAAPITQGGSAEIGMGVGGATGSVAQFGSGSAGSAGAGVSAERSASRVAAQPPMYGGEQQASWSQAPQQAQQTTRAVQPHASISTTAQTSATVGAPSGQADPFEPPPPGLSAAQIQARAAGAISPAPVAAAQRASAPDPIDAAADAFEPPPAASIVTRQARQAQQTDENGGVQIMRASTVSHGVPAPTQTNDDPIARFANGNF